LTGTVLAVRAPGDRVEEVIVRTNGGSTAISTRLFVDAAGPFLPHVARMVGAELPVFHELHIKVALRDHLRVLRRDAPLLIWCDPGPIPWSDEERSLLAESEETRYLLGEFPSGVHVRPEGGAESDVVLALWTYDLKSVEPVFPFDFDPYYPEIALRGLAVMIPGLKAYFGHLPKPVLDGGYYTKTAENRPLIGPLPLEGSYVIGAFSGFGLMASSAAGELLAAHITGNELPHYAPAFTPARYQDPAYQKLLKTRGQTGQI
jgi:glycine/D-amino acid oxidase-like deaminating enzyme